MLFPKGNGLWKRPHCCLLYTQYKQSKGNVKIIFRYFLFSSFYQTCFTIHFQDNPGYPQAVKNFLRRFDSKKVLEDLTLVTERITNLIVDNLAIIIADFESEFCQKSMTKYNSLVVQKKGGTAKRMIFSVNSKNKTSYNKS